MPVTPISPVQSDQGKQNINSRDTVVGKAPDNKHKITSNEKVEVKVPPRVQQDRPKLSGLNENNNDLESLNDIHLPQFQHTPLHHVELPPASQLAAVPKKEMYRPIGFVILPRASEPTLADTEKITWCQCCIQTGWNSLIFHEIWVSHFCFPLILTLGIFMLIWTHNEWKDHTLNFKAFSPVSTGIPSLIAGILLVITGGLLWFGSLRRSGALIIWSICLISLSILQITLIIGLAHVNSSITTVGEYLAGFLHGCEVIISTFLKGYLNIRWPHLIMTVVALILSLLCCIIYVSRVYERLVTHVHPHVRSVVDELVDKVDEDVFGFGTGADISEFDDQVRDYIRFNLSQCRTIEEVQEFLTATSDVHHYIRHLEPRELVTDILSGRPVLLERFQKKLESMKAQIGNEEPVDSQQESNKKYRRLVRARKDLHFLSKRIEHYKSFIDRVQQYHQSQLNLTKQPGHEETPIPKPKG
ncbi:unnamed protein product [Allacma fusca]|uniref:Uncharacterized protein n=1 Tax=Allacma fusca TaxID=39272 RepID=A0A8J2JWZ5_9HEXA|nr:unnamed protein product [Allacma fusca]